MKKKRKNKTRKSWWQRFLLKVCQADFRKKRSNSGNTIGRLNWRDREVRI